MGHPPLQARGMSIKTMPLSLVLEGGSGKVGAVGTLVFLSAAFVIGLGCFVRCSHGTTRSVAVSLS